MRVLFQTAVIALMTFTLGFSDARYDSVENQSPQQVLQSMSFYTETFPPFSYESDGGQQKGYAIDLLKQVFNELDLSEPDISFRAWDIGYMMTLITDKPTAIFFIAKTKKRQEHFQFSDTVLKISDKVYCLTKSNIKINDQSDLSKQHYVVPAGDVTAYLLTEKGVPKSNIKLVESYERVFKLLNADQYPCTAMSEAFKQFVKSNRNKPEQPIESLYLLKQTNQAFGFNKKTPKQVVKQFNSALQDVLNDDKFINKLNKQYHISQ